MNPQPHLSKTCCEAPVIDGCGAFLSDLAAALQQSLPPAPRISIWVEEDEVSLPAATERLLGTLVQELVLNAAKHAFGPRGGHIVIQLSQAEGRVCCSVRDNGLGLRGVDPQARGVGMSLVQLLAMRTGASCTWRVHYDGTEAVITVDAEAPTHSVARTARSICESM
jgi:two-component sensor histidine kinase